MTRADAPDLYWTESGRADAPPLVLSNSLGCTLDMWEHQLEALGEHHRVIRYDQRGHGGSPAGAGPATLSDLGSDVLALLDHLDVRSASFAGVSLGGMVGMWLAAHAPARIDRLALCCTSALLTPREMWLDRAAAVREHGTSEIVSATVERWFTPNFRQHCASETAQYAAMIANADDECYASCCEVIAGMDLRGDLASITVPTLVVAGADDPATPPEHGESIAAGIGGNARLEVVPHAAHLANVERPQEVNRLLVEALSG